MANVQQGQHELLLILDFGGQYKELIARRVRECGVLSIVRAGDISAAAVREMAPIGIILTGGPNSVYCADSPHCDREIFELGIPVLGICYGSQLLAWTMGGEVAPCSTSEYGRTPMRVDTSSPLFAGLDAEQIGLMSHTDRIVRLPEGFSCAASTDNCPNAALEDRARRLYGVQFHPEVESTPNGTAMIRNFLYNVCHAAGDYNLRDLEKQLTEAVRVQVGTDHVLLGLSGGVDSSVCAALLSRAIPGQLHCIFVDHGLMRKDEGDEVEAAFRGRDLHFIRVNAADRFLGALKGVTDPEQKRKIIGAEFINVFEKEAKKIGAVDFLVQGTIYPDVIESGKGKSAVIKSHHNVGGLPSVVDFKEIIEPLRDLFKDEVRRLGTELGLPDSVVWRQPCPGPALAIRIMGEVTREKLETLREADFIFREEIAKAGLDKEIWQYFAVITDSKTVGVQGDFRTYENVIALRAVTSVDAMTADWARIPFDVLETVSNRITNEVPHANRIVYDITSKPPATIEWE